MARLGLSHTEPLTEMRLLTADGRVFGGARAIVEIACRIWWARPLAKVARLPIIERTCERIYRRIAKNRTCTNGKCAVPTPIDYVAWLPLPLLTAFACLSGLYLPPWQFMVVVALALFYGGKWLTWRKVIVTLPDTNHLRSFAYLFLWVGMDARAFLQEGNKTVAPPLTHWFFAALKVCLGVFLLRELLPIIPPQLALVRNIAAFLGLLFVFHFGAFELLAFAWQALGINAEPIMKSPLEATSLAEFWGRRWNVAFHRLVHEYFFRPVYRYTGAVVTTMVVFLISGLIHDLVISVPAHGGYGLPTIYFLLQGVGMLVERTRPGRLLGLGRGWRGWLFTMTLVATPAVILFHPPFIHRVVMPLLQFLRLG